MLRDPGLIPLSHHQQQALGLCVLIDRALAAQTIDCEVVEKRARDIVDQFDTEMRKHFDFEETILFPALESFPDVHALVADLIAEHQRITSLVDSLRRVGDRGLMMEFSTLLREHIRKEERILFGEAQRLLTREQLDFIAGEFVRML
jgi:hemerythrin-like domain-containing protein